METTDESTVGVDEAVINAKRMQPCSQLKMWFTIRRRVERRFGDHCLKPETNHEENVELSELGGLAKAIMLPVFVA